MKVFSLITFALVGSACAVPSKDGYDNYGYRYHNKRGCLSKDDVKELSDAYSRLIGAFDEADLKYLADEFVDYSQSINAFISDPYPVDLVTFNKEALKQAQLAQIENPTPLVVLGEPVVECKRFALIWSSKFGYPPHDVRGITIIEAEPQKGSSHALMTRWDVEFNSLNWAENMGGSYCLFGGVLQRGDKTCAAGGKRSLQ